MQIEKILVVATNHLPEAEYQAIAKHSVMSRYEGDLIYVGTEDTEDKEVELIHFNVFRLIHKARKNGCVWLMFDRDAEPIEGITTFDW